MVDAERGMMARKKKAPKVPRTVAEQIREEIRTGKFREPSLSVKTPAQRKKAQKGPLEGKALERVQRKLAELKARGKKTRAEEKILKAQIAFSEKPLYYKVFRYTKRVSGKNRRFVGIFSMKGNQVLKLVKETRATQFHEVPGSRTVTDGFFMAAVLGKTKKDEKNSIAAKVMGFKWPCVVRSTVYGVLNGKKVRVVATTYLRRDNDLYKRKTTDAQRRNLAGYYIYKSILSSLRQLHANPSSEKHRKSASRHTKSKGFFDLPGKQTRFYAKSIKFQIAQ
jgi:hypothetical protein